jgi:hypothetical protein
MARGAGRRYGDVELDLGVELRGAAVRALAKNTGGAVGFTRVTNRWV